MTVTVILYRNYYKVVLLLELAIINTVCHFDLCSDKLNYGSGFTIFTFFLNISFLFNKLAKSSLSVDIRKQLNIQEAFSSERVYRKTENANLSCGEPETPTALKLRVGVFAPPPHKSILVERGYCSLLAITFKKYCVFYGVTNTGGKTRPEFSPFLKFCDICRF